MGQAIPHEKKLFIDRSWNYAQTKRLRKGFKMHYRTSAILQGRAATKGHLVTRITVTFQFLILALDFSRRL